jgi:predicted tellurium resistance membrane protein TerC
MAYRLSPPTQAVFIISLVLAILALLAQYTAVTIPVVSSHTFETLLLAFLLLLAGNLFRGF